MILCILHVNGRNEGHHWIRVPLRNGGRVGDGIRIDPAEPKGGVEANQTGIISFDHAVVPVSALMARWASIDQQGIYTSQLPRGRRFEECLATFTHERMFPAACAVQSQRLACAIAVRFASVRRVVSTFLIDRDHYRLRLSVPVTRALAGKHALEAMMALAVDRAAGRSPALDRVVHAVVACIKTGSTGDVRHSLAETRELCGGLGYHISNQIAPMLHDLEITVTLGGDNTVISYQAALIALRERPALDVVLCAAVEAAENCTSTSGHRPEMLGAQVRWMSRICQALLDRVQREGSGDASVAWARAVYQTLALGHWAAHEDSPAGYRLLGGYAATCLLEHAIEGMRNGIVSQADILRLSEVQGETGTALAAVDELLDLLAVPRQLITAPIAFSDFVDRHLAVAQSTSRVPSCPTRNSRSTAPLDQGIKSCT